MRPNIIIHTHLLRVTVFCVDTSVRVMMDIGLTRKALCQTSLSWIGLNVVFRSGQAYVHCFYCW